MSRIVVCGAGSAGCVVAARLSEDERNDVVLLEAGRDFETAEALPDELRDPWVVIPGPDHDWGYSSQDTNAPGDNPHPFAAPGETVRAFRGKVIGGSSSINGAAFIRPPSTDFERWVGLGADRWSWHESLPAFRALEDDRMGGERHGAGGPVPVRRYSESGSLRPIIRDFLTTCGAAGYPVTDNLNATDTGGAGPIPFNQVDRVRMNASLCYLTPNVRARDNLEIRSGALIDRIVLDGGRATGVVLAGGELIPADLVVLSAGAIGSPGVLMRSGVGPRSTLDELGIDVVVANEAVGRNLREHPMLSTIWALARNAGPPEPPLSAMLEFSSAGPGNNGDIDLAITPLTVGPDQMVALLHLVNPYSTGSITITSADPAVPPRIFYDLYGHPEDLQRMTRGVQLMRELFSHQPLASWIAEEIWPGPKAAGDGAVARSILMAKNIYSHATTTCCMGGAGTPWAVVDQFGKVHDLDGLYVIDASIMPRIPLVPTNMTTMMLAERCVSELRSTIVNTL